MKGYQLIEPDLIFELNGFQGSEELRTMVLSWAVDELVKDRELINSHVEINIVVVKHVSAYACIGVHYERPETTPDLESTIIEKITKLYSNAPFSNFQHYALNNIHKVSRVLQQVKSGEEAVLN